MLPKAFLDLAAAKLPVQSPWLMLMRELGSDYDINISVNVRNKSSVQAVHQLHVVSENLSLPDTSLGETISK